MWVFVVASALADDADGVELVAGFLDVDLEVVFSDGGDDLVWKDLESTVSFLFFYSITFYDKLFVEISIIFVKS